MSAKLGILGESTAYALGTTTVYTVPSDKAARIRWSVQSSGGGGATRYFAVQVGAPGSETVVAVELAAEYEVWSGALISTATYFPKDIGLTDTNVSWGPNTSAAQKDLVAPLPVDWYLSTGDTVKFIITTVALEGMLFQVVGVEDDA